MNKYHFNEPCVSVAHFETQEAFVSTFLFGCQFATIIAAKSDGL